MPAERAMTDIKTGKRINFCRIALGKHGCSDEEIMKDEDGYCKHLVGFRMSEDSRDPNFKLMETWRPYMRPNTKGVLFNTGYKQTGPGGNELDRIQPILDSDSICNPEIRYEHEGRLMTKGTFFNARVYRADPNAKPAEEQAPKPSTADTKLDLILAQLQKVNERIDKVEKKVEQKPRKRAPQKELQTA